jgi:hypothetical protein
MKYILFFSTILGAIFMTAPVRAQFSSLSTGLDSCSSICVKLDLGSSNNDTSFGSGFNGGFNSGSPTTPNNLRWQLGITWRPNPPEFTQGEAERLKQRLEDNRSLMLTLADAIAQNKTELARGIAILLAPRLNYRDPRTLLAEMKEGSINVGSAKIEVKPVANTIISPSIDPKKETTTIEPAQTIELR